MSKSPAQLEAEIAEALAEPRRSALDRFNDLNRQGFMKPKRSRAAKPSPPTVSCDGCMNWHPQGRHTARASERKVNLATMKAMRAAMKAP